MGCYIWFVPHVTIDPYPNGMSGIKTTTGYDKTGIPGYWCSSRNYGTQDNDWWRSICGHTVDKAFTICPVCDEKQPELSKD